MIFLQTFLRHFFLRNKIISTQLITQMGLQLNNKLIQIFLNREQNKTIITTIVQSVKDPA